MDFLFCSYANGEYYAKCQQRLEGMIKAQEFDNILSYNATDIDEDFKLRYKRAFDEPRVPTKNGTPTPIYDGACLWKLHILMKALSVVRMGDIVFYMDTEDIIQGPPVLQKYLVDKTEVNNGFATIKFPCTNAQYTRKDTFVLMGCDTPEYWYAPQVEAGFLGIKKTLFTMEFIGQWMTYNTDPQITGSLPPNLYGSNFPEFVEHRNDQSVYSLLIKKFNIQSDWLHQGPQAYGLNHMLNIPLENS